MLKTEKYTRKPFIIEAVQVTEDNMEEVAVWCRGKVLTTNSQIAAGLHKDPERYIQVEVQNPLNERQKRAFVNDWVLFANQGFKVYTPRAFERSFDLAFQESEKQSVPTPAVMASSE